MARNQSSVIVPSLGQVVLGCFLLTAVFGSSEGLGDGVVILTPGSSDPPTDSVTVVEGATLIMHCLVPTDMLQGVSWGKHGENGEVYLTDNATLLITDYRVSVLRSANFIRNNMNLRNYTVQIGQAAPSDAGFYFCNAGWKLNDTNYVYSKGKVTVSVPGFKNGIPKCWSTHGCIKETLAWCKTEHAYPGVSITWTVEETGQVVSVTSPATDTDNSGRKWVRSSYQVSRELQKQVLVCTVMSRAFLGRSQTCSIAPPVNTTVNPDATNALTGPTSECLEATSATRPLTSTSVTSGPITGSSPDVVTVSAAVAIPLVTLLLVALLLCILIRRRRQPGANGRGKNSGTTTEGIRSNCEAGRSCGVVAAPVTRMPHHGSGKTTGAGGDAFVSPYEEMELDHPVAGSATSAEAPDKDGLGQNTCVIYQTVHPAGDSDCDTSSWESDSMQQERVNSYNDNVVAGGDSDSDKFEASLAGRDESDGGMVDNPIYQSCDDEYPSY